MFSYDIREHTRDAAEKQYPYLDSEDGVWDVIITEDNIERSAALLKGRYGVCRQYAARLLGKSFLVKNGRLKKVNLSVISVPDNYAFFNDSNVRKEKLS